MKSNHFQILDVSDFRLPGGTSHSIAAEISAQSEAGISTGIAHVDSDIQKKAHPWSAPIREVVAAGKATVISPTQRVTAGAVVIRHPGVVAGEEFFPYSVDADRVFIVANHVPVDADGSINYEVEAVDQLIRKRFEVTPVWFPIGPVVREGLTGHAARICLSDMDWRNILTDLPENYVLREPRLRRPRIGRHSREQPAKWPEDPKVIRQAYPLDDEFEVRILGGAKPAISALGKRPAKWSIYPFGSMTANTFLQKVDFWVYYHHSRLREAFGRAIMEALMAGCVVILPRYLEESYGSAALYAEPEEVRDLLRRYTKDLTKFREQSLRGQEFARLFAPSTHIERLRALGVLEAPSESAESMVQEPPKGLIKKPLALLITSNGAGMGHLTRLLSIATAGKEYFDSVFVSLSAAAPVVKQFGFAYEYVMSSGALGVTYKPWNPYFEERVNALLTTYRPDVLVFDGTSPYGGLQRAIRQQSILRVWMRRGMWKSHASAATLDKAKDFDVVIEPGDYAAEYDSGATKNDVTPIEPIVLVTDAEQLDRASARAELGIESAERAVIITLGAGNINSISEVQNIAIQEFTKLGWRVFVTKAPISVNREDSDSISTATVLQVYPLARLAKAFDAVVSACGYNSYHEWMAAGVPGIWIPNANTSVDDQEARARFAQDRHLGYHVDAERVSRLPTVIGAIDDEETRDEMRSNMALLERPQGAVTAARLIASRLDEDAIR